MLRIVLNVIWLIFAGLWATILWCLAGIVMCILIITIPFGIQAFKIASFTIWPFGRTLVKRAEAGAASAIGNVIWFCLLGSGSRSPIWSPPFCWRSRSSGFRWPWPT
jgi:uncharacterized membrane protein YccF (DUF307 family)